MGGKPWQHYCYDREKKQVLNLVAAATTVQLRQWQQVESSSNVILLAMTGRNFLNKATIHLQQPQQCSSNSGNS